VAVAERANLQVLTADDKLVRAFAALNRAVSLASFA
jgi:predicted nucleic acid-binding protein